MNAQDFEKILDDALVAIAKKEMSRVDASALSLIAGRRIQHERNRLAKNIADVKHKIAPMEFFKNDPKLLSKK